MGQPKYAPGMRVIIRDEEWLVRRYDEDIVRRSDEKGKKKEKDGALTVVGLSSLTRGHERVFLTELEKNIKIADPRNTEFARDFSPNFSNSRLFIESHLRQTCPTDEKIYVGGSAAIDDMDFQFTPAIMALKAPRPRILIADSVGLGKTIECGILLSELIRRGRGKRILVLTVKSMTAQFQKELWARFSIPLVQLDSVGIQRVRARIPANANPFYYYDKAIISIDTLKRADQYRSYLENSRWDIVVIDEAHNVAERGSSQRSRLAKLISTRCDALVMLSATPHDGRKRSFASLIDMLDPTAIIDPDAYGAEEVRGLFVRRFKKDVKKQMRAASPERIVENPSTRATQEEEDAFDYLAKLEFKRVDAHRRGDDMLFRCVLEKALFSSPDACRETIANRLRTLDDENTDDAKEDAKKLRELDALVKKITPEKFSRYELLLDVLSSKRKSAQSIGWTGKNPKDRVVIFAERVKTVDFLVERLQKDLGLPKGAVVKMDASLGDVEINKTIAKFGVEKDPCRILVCTDVASEGVNLHYLCRHLIHFDTPWSLITFQQRNGRIDRYGQERQPEIRYLTIETENEKIRGDLRVLELLKKKDEEVVETIGDPSEFTNRFSAKEEEAQTAAMMERQNANDADDDFFDSFFSAEEPQEMNEVIVEEESNAILPKEVGSFPTLYQSERDYLVEALAFQRSKGFKERFAGKPLEFQEDVEEKLVKVTPNESLRQRFKYYPDEILPFGEKINLSSDRTVIRDKYREAIQNNKWPEIQLLWNAHPLVQYVNETILAAFGRLCAPIMTIDKLPPNETLFIIASQVPNRQSQPVTALQLGILCRDGKVVETQPLEYWIDKLALNANDKKNKLINPLAKSNPEEQIFEKVKGDEYKELKIALEAAVDEAIRATSEIARQKRDELKEKSREYEKKLNDWKQAKLRPLGEDAPTLFDKTNLYGENATRNQRTLRDQVVRIKRVFQEHDDWFHDAAEIDADRPAITVLAAITGEGRASATPAPVTP